MLGDCKNEKTLKSKLEKWRVLDKNKLLVHTINPSYMSGSRTSELCRRPAEDVFRSWDVFSTSLIDLKELKIARREAEDMMWEGDRGPAGHYDVGTGLWFEIGLVLDVKPQNILGTHEQDAWFPNHIGANSTNRQDAWKLVDSIISGRGMPSGKMNWPSAKGHSYNRILTPNDLISKTEIGRHNEVLVIGKSGINIYPGYAPTEMVKVKSIVVAKQMMTKNRLFNSACDEELDRAIKILIKINKNLKVVGI